MLEDNLSAKSHKDKSLIAFLFSSRVVKKSIFITSLCCLAGTASGSGKCYYWWYPFSADSRGGFHEKVGTYGLDYGRNEGWTVWHTDMETCLRHAAGGGCYSGANAAAFWTNNQIDYYGLYTNGVIDIMYPSAQNLIDMQGADRLDLPIPKSGACVPQESHGHGGLFVEFIEAAP